MKSRSSLGLLRTMGAILALLLPAGLTVRATAQAPTVNYNYFPTGKVNDGKFLALAGTGVATLAGDTITVSFTAPPGTASFEVGLFDGDTGAYTDANGQPVAGNPSLGHWDTGTAALEYSLYADPRGDARGRFLIGRWMGNGGDGTIAGGINTRPMPDNGWFDIPVATGPEARNPNGHYYYVLRVRNTNPSAVSISGFKVRSDAVISILAQAVSLYCPLGSFQEFNILNPAGQPSNYDGTWDINISVPTPTSFLEVWDGDCDYGNHPSMVPQTFDTDDPDTPNAPFLPAWSPGTAAVPEGVSVASVFGWLGKGNPADDSDSEFFRRSPSIVYDIYHTDAAGNPDGQIYTNLNPSGDREWERFLITTDPAATRNNADYAPNAAADGTTFVPAGNLPAGNWRMRIRGMDVGNLDAFRFLHDAVGVDPDGELIIKVPPDPVVVLGDYVWLDSDREGDQDETKAGIAGVKMEAVNSSGVVMDVFYTNLDGFYYYPVKPHGTYTVRVAADNFLPGGRLYGLSSTTSGNALTRSVALDDDLTYDFGYAPRILNSNLGDTVWLDGNGNGVQDNGETGLSGVTVRLLDSTGAVLGTQVTDAAGLYLYTQLEAGTYSTVVDPATLPAGLVQTYDLDGLGTPHKSTVTLGVNATNLDLDYGYKPAPAQLGDRVWLDTDKDGVQDSGETGVAGVTVSLLDSTGAVAGTTTTDADGSYLFANLPAGSYGVQFTLPADRQFTTANQGSDLADSDADSTTGRTVTVILAPGESNLSLDAGLVTVTNDIRPFRTQTQGGWGTAPSGNNPGAFLAANFSAVFPNGITVGSGKTLRLTSAKAVENFLPQGGKADVFKTNYTNPTSTSAGVLAGQLTAATISQAFSAAGKTRTGLGALKAQSGKFAGYTADQIIAIGHAVIGGNLGALPAGKSITDLNDALTKINENFVDGTENHGFLK